MVGFKTGKFACGCLWVGELGGFRAGGWGELYERQEWKGFEI